MRASDRLGGSLPLASTRALPIHSQRIPCESRIPLAFLEDESTLLGYFRSLV
jgi:hypothetical protein